MDPNPLIISRHLYHNEFVFNLKIDKNTHFAQGAGVKWRLCEKCWLCDKSRYTVIVFNRELASKYFTEVTEPSRLYELKQKYKLSEYDSIVDQRPDAVQIMGDFTDNVVCNMLDINMFNLLLDKYSLRENYGKEAGAMVDEIINAALGMENYVGKCMKKMEFADSYGKLFKNMPFKSVDTTMLGITNSIELRSEISKIDFSSGQPQRQQSVSNNDIFVFAGYLQPGKHELVIHDTKTHKVYLRDFIADVRTCDVLQCKLKHLSNHLQTPRQAMSSKTKLRSSSSRLRMATSFWTSITQSS